MKLLGCISFNSNVEKDADGVEKYNAGVVVPIVSEGDTIGSVLFILKEGETASEVEEKLAESAAGFLGKHMEG